MGFNHEEADILKAVGLTEDVYTRFDAVIDAANEDKQEGKNETSRLTERLYNEFNEVELALILIQALRQ